MITVAIPTYNRGAILLDTLGLLPTLDPPPDEILVVDQTSAHPPEVARKLAAMQGIRLITLEQPSIPHAMNIALEEATHEIVLFLDDDSFPSPHLLREHARAYEDAGVWAVVGQVLQPGEEPIHAAPKTGERLRDLEFPFNHDEARDVENVIACNLSVRRSRALEIGGFDENYIQVAYRFETDFARRIVAAGGRVRFEPKASIRHLKIPTGGVRAYGDHRTSPSPAHSIGDYYFARRHARSFWLYVLQRLRKNVLTRFHLTHPWTIPAKLTGELRGLTGSARLARDGPRLHGPRNTTR
jgi:GT2 family glycosyltransferase